jgi:tRNA splicing endonuclease
MKDCTIVDEYVEITDKKLILKLRGLGAGVEHADKSRITLLEGAYFSDKGVLPIQKEELMRIARKADQFADEKFSIIKYLRDRGYIVRPSLDGSRYLRLHRKGFRPGEERTYALVEVVKKDWRASPDSLEESLRFAGRLRKELFIAIANPFSEKPKFLKFGRISLD